jgi:CHAT domain-containing protein
VLHIAGHAIYDSKQAQTAALHLGEDDILDAGTILRHQDRPCQADLVTLSSCMSGFSSVVAGDELFGLQRAFLSAIAPTVVCTMAKVRDRVTLLVMVQLYTRLLDVTAQATEPGAALRDALVAVRTMTRDEINATLVYYGYASLPPGGQGSDQPFARPEYWAPFILIGRP